MGRDRGARALSRAVRDWAASGLAKLSQQRVSAALRASEERLQAVTENLTEGLIIANIDGQLLHWNRAALALHGYASMEEVLRQRSTFASTFTFSTLEGEPVAFDDAPMGRVLRGERLREMELRIARTEWQRVFSYSGSIVEDASGNRMAFVAINDVTAAREAERRLVESEARYRGTLDRMMEGCQIIDRQWRYLYLNAAAGEHGKRLPAELIGKTMMEVYPGIEETPLFAKLTECMNERRASSMENAFAHPDGTHAIFELAIEPVAEGILVASLDVTKERLAQDAILELNATLELRVDERTAQLEAANHELEAFSYSISHDLRAPLRAVDGFSHAVLEEYGPLLPEEGRRYLHTIRAGAQRMGVLIDDLLMFSRLSRSPLRSRPVAMDELVATTLREVTAQHVGRQVEVTIGALPQVEGDPALLKQVWVNLISNAFKYTGKIPLPVVEIGSRAGANGTVFYVKDNGTGFDMRFAHKLFGVFQRLHRDDEYEGTGVGLAIVQRIVTRHGGRVWAEAVEGRGATFHFTLDVESAS